MTVFTQIYVRLLNEGIDVWRAVIAVRLHGNVHRILDQPYDASIETWEFEPGDEVSCKETQTVDGHRVAAVIKVGHFAQEI